MSFMPSSMVSSDRMAGLGAGLRDVDWSSTKLVDGVWRYYDVEQLANRRVGEKEIADYFKEHTISIYGKDVPAPMFSFGDLAAPEPVHRTFREEGYTTPTPIQAVAWPIILHSRDLVGIARTGSGKTMAFMVPAVLHIRAQPALRTGDGPIALVLAPTRELACQIEEEARKVTKRFGDIHTAVLYGGASKYTQLRAIRAGIHICIATPGRLIDMVTCNATNLLRVTYLVLDEADRMLDMGFEPQIRSIVGQIRKDRQTLMFSATWPREIRDLASSFQKEYVRIHVGSEELQANADVRQHIVVADDGGKNLKLIEIMRAVGRQRILIFTKTKRMADVLQSSMLRSGINAMVIHGDKDQAHRERCVERFRRDPTSCLVATDVAARGLDIKDLDVVINYDMPTAIEDYVHRIGRTGRAGKAGDAYSIVTPADPSKVVRDLIDLMRRGRQAIPPDLESLAMSGGGGGRRFGGGGGRGGGAGYMSMPPLSYDGRSGPPPSQYNGGSRDDFTMSAMRSVMAPPPRAVTPPREPMRDAKRDRISPPPRRRSPSPSDSSSDGDKRSKKRHRKDKRRGGSRSRSRSRSRRHRSRDRRHHSRRHRHHRHRSRS